ncbi:unnamed protein product, partial [Phaeothamnion confervicola]
PFRPSKEELLEKAGVKAKSKEEIAEAKRRRAEAAKERLERQKQLQAEQNDPSKPGADIDANLRANYYFPTARKRYLPRIKAANDEIRGISGLLAAGRWGEVAAFVEGAAEAAALPLKLYASSLSGQGLSLDVSYTKVMAARAEDYGRNLAALRAAVKVQDAARAKASLAVMDAALQDYRRAAKIDTPDGGIGEVAEKAQGSSFLNNSPSTYMKR